MILVTGATGRLGTAVVQNLLEKHPPTKLLHLCVMKVKPLPGKKKG